MIEGLYNVKAQSLELSAAYNDVTKTFKEFDVTSVDIKEIDRFCGNSFSGSLMFKEQKITYDGTNLVISYKQVPKKDCYANSKYWNPGSYTVLIPIEGTTLELPSINSYYASRGQYCSVKIKNDSGITMATNGTKELIVEYTFATSQELTAKKFHKELSKLFELLSEENFKGKLGVQSISAPRNTSAKKTNTQPSTKQTTKPKTSTPNQTSTRRTVNNVGNKSTKTIIK